jgi:hypothetical protein
MKDGLILKHPLWMIQIHGPIHGNGQKQKFKHTVDKAPIVIL